MDPFSELFIGGDLKLKTNTHKDGHTNPVWNQEIDYQVKNMSEEVKLQVYAEGIFSNELVGTGSFQVADFCHEGEISYTLSHEEEEAGTIRFQTSWINFHGAKAKAGSLAAAQNVQAANENQEEEKKGDRHESPARNKRNKRNQRVKLTELLKQAEDQKVV